MKRFIAALVLVLLLCCSVTGDALIDVTPDNWNKTFGKTECDVYILIHPDGHEFTVKKLPEDYLSPSMIEDGWTWRCKNKSKERRQ